MRSPQGVSRPALRWPALRPAALAVSLRVSRRTGAQRVDARAEIALAPVALGGKPAAQAHERGVVQRRDELVEPRLGESAVPGVAIAGLAQLARRRAGPVHVARGDPQVARGVVP